MRKEESGFTLIELLVVIAIIALLMSVLLPSLNKARRQTKRAVCLSNMKQLVLGWLQYAEHHDGRIVNGGQSQNNKIKPKEVYWCSPVNPSDGIFDWTMSAPIETRIEKMKEGGLYRYLKDIDVYRCPEADRREVQRTYLMPNSMNGHWDDASKDNNIGEGEVIKNLSQIRRTQERIVFMEETKPTPDALIVPYLVRSWYYTDHPSCLHENGSNFGFADGHSEYWRWECDETLEACPYGKDPDTKNCKDDIIKVQIGTWGRLGHKQ